MTMSSVRQAAIQEEPLEAEAALEQALDALLETQREDGHWVFELEADATISAEYVLMVHYLGETPDPQLETLYFQFGRQLAMGDQWPNWYPTAEFRGIRDKDRAAK